MRRVLVVQNTAGSVEHYYHFFFAVLLPLLERIVDGTIDGRSLLRSCGPMDRHLQLLQDRGLAQLELLEKDRVTAVASRVPRHPVQTLRSFECYDARGLREDGYQPDVFRRVRAFVLATVARDAPPVDVLLVERGDPEPFYLSPRAEIRGGAGLRRSLPNADELAHTLARSGREVTRLRLERLNLVQQVEAFSRAKVVVAQHGAGLANVLWMAEGSRLVEIIPRRQGLRECFCRIADVVGASYTYLDQDDDHAPIATAGVVHAIAGAAV
jgi:hypothetical protein